MKKRIFLIFLLLCLVAFGPQRFLVRATSPLESFLYDDSLANSWTNWSWNTDVNFKVIPGYTGSTAIAANFSGWGGLYLHSNGGLDTTPFSEFRFALKPTAPNQKFRIIFYDTNNQPTANGLEISSFGGNPITGSWTLYKIPLSAANAANRQIKGVAIQEATGYSQPTTDIDALEFINPTANQPTKDLTIFSNGLSSGWSNWSWNANLNFGSAISYQSLGQWSGLYLHTENGISLANFTNLNFTARTSGSGQKYAVILYDNNNQPIGNSVFLANFGGDPLPDSYKTYSLPLAGWPGGGQILKGVAIQDISSTQGTLFINNLTLSGNSPAVSPTPVPSPTPTTSTTTPPASQTPAASLPTGQTGGFSVANGKIYQNGSLIALHGLNWFGFETDTHVVHGLWVRNYQDIISQIKSLGFNAVRLPYCPDSVQGATPSSIDYSKNPDLTGLNSLGVLDKIITEMNNRGILVLLDSHRPDCNAQSELWYTDSYPESQWTADLVSLAKRYAGMPNFIGLDLKNEPHGAATWGTGNLATDWNLAAERAGKAVLAANPNILVFVEGIGDNPACQDNNGHFWGGNLAPVKCTPLNLPASKYVYSPHIYGPDVAWQSYFGASDFPNNMPGIWDAQWGYLAGTNALAPGEWGGKDGNSGGNPADATWQNAFAQYLTSRKICNSFYWDLNPDSGDTGGVLQDNWTTPWNDKVSLLQNYFNSCR